MFPSETGLFVLSEELHNEFTENSSNVVFSPQVLRYFVFLHYFPARFEDLFLFGE